MNTLITCPSCQTRLRVPEGAEGTSYTCPRCLGEIRASAPTPAEIGGYTSTPAPERIRPEPERAASSECPLCGFALSDPAWRYCPGCASPMRSLAAPPRRAQTAFDQDVSQDGQRTGWFAMTLLVLGVLALLAVGMGSLGGGPGGFTAFLFAMMVLTGIVWGVAYARTRNRPEQFTAGRVARGVVMTVGAFVFGYFVLALVAVVCIVLAFMR